MPMKKEAIDLLNNRFFQMIKRELESEYYEQWQAADTVAEREDLFMAVNAFNQLIERIEHEAETYEPPKLDVA